VADGTGQRSRVGFVVSVGESTGPFEARLQKFRDSGVLCSWINCSLADNRPAQPSPATRAASTVTMAESVASTLRVDSEVLDRFVGRVGEMVTLRNAMSHSLHDDDLIRRLRLLRGKFSGSTQALTLQVDELPAIRALLQELDSRIDGLMQADARFQGALSRLQEDVLALRVVPIATVFNRLPRVVRDVAQSCSKQVETELEGEDVRIDKSMVEALLEPLMHLVRNSVDHGIETPLQRQAAGKAERGRITIRANQHAGLLDIDIEDDGAGMDIAGIRAKAMSSGIRTGQQVQAMSRDELVALIFEPGFSTATQVTEVSGRGVGMDVVRNRIQHLGGTISVESEPGKGTCFRLRLPLSLAIQNVVLVQAGSQHLALPERYVGEVIALQGSMLQSVQGQAACLLRGVTLPLFRLSTLLGQTRSAQTAEQDQLEALVISDGSHRIGLIVDAVLGRPEVFIREVHPDIARMPGISGVSILGSGQVVIILDCDAIIALAASNAQSLRSLLKAS
jgi:two-component system, chemotaxis family, sensor kinase CheA